MRLFFYILNEIQGIIYLSIVNISCCFHGYLKEYIYINPKLKDWHVLYICFWVIPSLNFTQNTCSAWIIYINCMHLDLIVEFSTGVWLHLVNIHINMFMQLDFLPRKSSKWPLCVGPVEVENKIRCQLCDILVTVQGLSWDVPELEIFQAN